MDVTEFAQAKGFSLPNVLIDQKIHRFKRNGARRDNCWYIGFSSGVVQFGDWASGETFTYAPGSNGSTPSLTAAERKQIERARAEYEAERELEAEIAARDAEKIFSGAQNTIGWSKYLEQKKITDLYGARTRIAPDGTRTVIVPMRFIYTESIGGIQRILSDGTKLFQKGQRTRGLAFMIAGDDGLPIAVCEGYATAVSIHKSTGMTVYAALSAKNLQPVCEAIKKRFKGRDVVVCGDADKPGREAAEACFGCYVVYPEDDGDDFNDVELKNGTEAVKLRVLGFRLPDGDDKKQADVMAPATFPLKFSLIANVVNSGEIGERFYVVEPEKGKRKVLYNRGDDVVCYCTETAVTAAILKYTEVRRGFGFQPRHASDCMRHWLYTTDPIAEPPIVRMRSDAGLCFHRLPFDPVPYTINKHPKFDEFLSRTSNKAALIDWIGSLFNLYSDRQQYIWLYGEGNNGKGAFIRFLEKCFGPSYGARETPGRGDKFWNFGLLGKRLIGFPDCGDHKFPTSQKFKMLTGDDAVPMEAKGKQEFSARINCKFIFASNEKPSITSQISDRRRAIYCEVEQIPGAVDPLYEVSLWNEAPFVIGTCIEEYKRKYPQNGPIDVDKDHLELIIDEAEMDLMRVFRFYFNDADDKDAKPILESGGLLTFTTHELADVIKHEKINKNEFIKFIKTKFGISSKIFKLKNGKTERKYIGAARKITPRDPDGEKELVTEKDVQVTSVT